MEFRINWSGRSDFYTQEELDIICSVAKYADPQTKGRYLSEFENLVSTYLNLPTVFGVS